MREIQEKNICQPHKETQKTMKTRIRKDPNLIAAVILTVFVLSSFALIETATAAVGDGPDPIFEKPVPITISQLSQKKFDGVLAVEVNNYLPGGFKGELSPCPPHADLNPQKAVIIAWEKGKHRFVFSHEASYCPYLELPSGVGLCNQFFEGNLGWGELFNASGRRERNSFVDIIRSGPDKAWVRWHYFCVNMTNDTQPALRGTEDYIAYPNGLVWRRMTYQSMMPDKVEGYAWDPIEFISIIPAGVPWQTLFPRDEQHHDYHVVSVLDAYSDKRYDVYWSEPGGGAHGIGSGKARRTGDAALLKQISQSKGFAVVMPFKDGYMFSVLGDASGFPKEKSQVIDHSFTDTGGWGWLSWELDHWPVGWINSQGHTREPNSPYPYCICPLGHYVTNRWIDKAGTDYFVVANDMHHNKWSQQRVFYMLIGIGKDFESIHNLARQWLDNGKDCARPESIAELRTN